MISSPQAELDPQIDGSESTNDSSKPVARSLMVRPADNGALAPYMGNGFGSAPYLDGTPQGLSFTQLLHALRRRWLLALLTGLMIALPTAAVVWLVTPENVDVQATLRVGNSVNWNGEQKQMDTNSYEQYRKTQAALIKGHLVLAGALKEEGIMELPIIHAERGSPIRFLEDEISVVAPLGTDLIWVKMRGRDPTQLVKIVNAVKQSYLKNVVEVEHTQTLQARDLLENQLRESENDVAKKRDQANKLEKITGSPDAYENIVVRDQLVMRTQTLNQQIVAKESEISAVDGQLEMIKARTNNKYQPPQYLVDQLIEHDPTYSKSQEQLQAAKQALDQTRSSVKNPDRDPTVKQLQGMVAGIQSQMDQRHNDLLPKIIEQLKMAGPGGQALNELKTPEELEAQKSYLEKDLAAKQKEYEEVSTKSREMTQSSADLKQLKADITQADQFVATLKTQLVQSGMELHMPNRVTVLENAQMPEGSTGLFRILVTVFSGILGLALGAGAVVGVEYQAHRLSSTGELSTRTGLRVLGTVPNLAALAQAKGINGSAALAGILAESVDSIRTMLLQQSRDDAPRVIMVTSAGDREGKTTVAAHLAASLARSGRRTLLVDGDLRAPSAHAVFNAAGEPGLCEILRSEVTLEAAIQPTQVDGLMLVAAGQCDYQAIAALSHALLGEIFQKVREQFEFIVIDAAPVLSYADTLLIGSHVDAAVLSVRRDVSQLTKVYEARERMESVGIRLLGAVVNGITDTGRRPAYALTSAS